MRQTKEHSVVLARVRACLDFLHGRSLSFSLTMKGSFVLLLTVTWQRMLTFAITCQRDNGWSLFATTWNFLKLGTLLRRSWWNLLSWNIRWWYNRGAIAWSLLPLHYHRSHSLTTSSYQKLIQPVYNNNFQYICDVHVHNYSFHWRQTPKGNQWLSIDSACICVLADFFLYGAWATRSLSRSGRRLYV